MIERHWYHFAAIEASLPLSLGNHPQVSIHNLPLSEKNNVRVGKLILFKVQLVKLKDD